METLAWPNLPPDKFSTAPRGYGWLRLCFFFTFKAWHQKFAGRMTVETSGPRLTVNQVAAGKDLQRSNSMWEFLSRSIWKLRRNTRPAETASTTWTMHDQVQVPEHEETPPKLQMLRFRALVDEISWNLGVRPLNSMLCHTGSISESPNTVLTMISPQNHQHTWKSYFCGDLALA